MTDGGASGCAGETAVGDERHAVAQSGAHDGRCRVEHFAHARTSLGTFVADHNHFTRIDLTAVNGVQGILFTVKHASLAAVGHHFRCNGSTFDHGAFGGEVAF